MEVEKKERIIVGVNKYQIKEKPPEGLLRVDASVGDFQKGKLAKMKAARDNAAVQAKLAALETACKDEHVNLMPFILDAVRTYATLGEICGVMRKVFGEYQPHVSL
jgi:methylmalonyl-CoA mutase N-terminal domain/subunit